MAQETLMGTAVRLSSSMEALAALAAYARLGAEEVEADPQVRALLGAVAEELLGDRPAIGDGAAAPVVGMVRAFLRQAADLVENPGRSGGWDQVDETLLQGLGRLSATITDAFRAAEGSLDGLGDRLRGDGAAFLDVGTGTAWLAIAMARAFPGLRVVGIDIFEPALALARRNVASQGLEGWVELRRQDVVALDEDERYEAVWLPLPFIPQAVVGPALAACARVLRPGGWVLAGTFAAPDDRLAQLLVDLRTVRSGGHPWQAAELLGAISAQGLADAREVPRTWAAPVRLYAGRRS